MRCRIEPAAAGDQPERWPVGVAVDGRGRELGLGVHGDRVDTEDRDVAARQRDVNEVLATQRAEAIEHRRPDLVGVDVTVDSCGAALAWRWAPVEPGRQERGLQRRYADRPVPTQPARLDPGPDPDLGNVDPDRLGALERL